MGAVKARGSLSPSRRPAGAQRSPWLRRRLASDIGEDVVSGGRAKGRLWPRLSQLNLSNLGARLLQVHFEITACFCLEAMGAVGQRGLPARTPRPPGLLLLSSRDAEANTGDPAFKGFTFRWRHRWKQDNSQVMGVRTSHARETLPRSLLASQRHGDR